MSSRQVEAQSAEAGAEPATAPRGGAAGVADWRGLGPHMEVGSARALQRAIGNRRFGRLLARKTPGEVAFDTARIWLDQDANVKIETDVLRAAIKEIKKGTKVQFNRDAGKTRLATALSHLGRSGDQATVEAEWTWLVTNRASSATDAYKRKERAFFAHFETPLAKETAAHKGSRATYWLRNSPAQVLDEVIFAANQAGLPPAELYAYAMVEGLDDWVRDEIGLGAADKREPTVGELAGVNAANPITGFGHLGMDDFWADLSSSREPLTGHLPTGYDLSVLLHQPSLNEETPPRLVDSVIFPTLRMGLQGLAASIKRRRTIFLSDAARFGYALPTRDETVYWTYIYSNVGENVSQLSKYQGKRTLSDWITRGEYPNAIALLQSFRMIDKMAIF